MRFFTILKGKLLPVKVDLVEITARDAIWVS